MRYFVALILAIVSAFSVIGVVHADEYLGSEFVNGYEVKRFLLDNGCIVEIIPYDDRVLFICYDGII